MALGPKILRVRSWWGRRRRGEDERAEINSMISHVESLGRKLGDSRMA